MKIDPDPIADSAGPYRMLYNAASGLDLQCFSHKFRTLTLSSVIQGNRNLSMHMKSISRVDPDPISNNEDPNRMLCNLASGLGLQCFPHRCPTHTPSSVTQGNGHLKIPIDIINLVDPNTDTNTNVSYWML